MRRNPMLAVALLLLTSTCSVEHEDIISPDTDDAITVGWSHLDALERTGNYLEDGQIALREGRAGELLAEDLRLAQMALSEITGEFTADDLLGEIFSSFCIGK